MGIDGLDLQKPLPIGETVLATMKLFAWRCPRQPMFSEPGMETEESLFFAGSNDSNRWKAV